jgi:hypothetical protein
MRLVDLDPRLSGTLEDGVLRFACPLGAACPFSKGKAFHTLVVRVGKVAGPSPTGHYIWQAEGRYPDTLTLSPSINEYEADATSGKVYRQGWHGFIRHGDVVTV